MRARGIATFTRMTMSTRMNMTMTQMLTAYITIDKGYAFFYDIYNLNSLIDNRTWRQHLAVQPSKPVSGCDCVLP